MSSPVRACALAGDPFYWFSPWLPSSSPSVRPHVLGHLRLPDCGRVRVGCRCLRPVARVSAPTPHRLPRRFAMWTRNHLRPSRFASCTRLALRFPSITIAGFLSSSVPFLGHRFACAIRYVAHSERGVTAGQVVFFSHTGLSDVKASYAQNNFGRPLFAHRLFTEALTQRARNRLNGGVTSQLSTAIIIC